MLRNSLLAPRLRLFPYSRTISTAFNPDAAPGIPPEEDPPEQRQPIPPEVPKPPASDTHVQPDPSSPEWTAPMKEEQVEEETGEVEEGKVGDRVRRLRWEGEAYWGSCCDRVIIRIIFVVILDFLD